jgi:hypothetical protein
MPSRCVVDVCLSTVGLRRAFVLSSFDMYASEAGIILFTYSLLLTRGLWKIREDMDDSSACLTCEYGHCTQELLNLLLTSRATSQVFDGEKPMGDSGLVFKGVFRTCASTHCIPNAARSHTLVFRYAERPHTGYLSYLEALRYLEVGSYYKTPLDPIWVIGRYLVRPAEALSAHMCVILYGQRGPFYGSFFIDKRGKSRNRVRANSLPRAASIPIRGHKRACHIFRRPARVRYAYD